MIHLQEVSRAILKMCQRQSVILVDMDIRLSLQEGALIVRVGHRKEGIWIADKFIYVSLSSHLEIETKVCMRGQLQREK